jgi:uncharacterized protein Yka (UPF0111/DUF47 family)
LLTELDHAIQQIEKVEAERDNLSAQVLQGLVWHTPTPCSLTLRSLIGNACMVDCD